MYLTFAVSENLFYVYCSHWLQVRKCALDTSSLEVFSPPDLKSGVSYSESPMPLKDHAQYCSLM